MTAPPPAPLEWHPAYRDQTWLLAWLEGRGGGYPTHMQLPILHPVSLLDDGPIPADRRILTRQKAWGAAPYVGRPFVYRWWCAVDELGRGIAGDAWLVYASEDFTFCSGSFDYTHEARNGHDPDTPVWP